MATHSSALKRHRQSLKRSTRNVAVKSAIKTAIKKVKEAIEEGKTDEAKIALTKATRLLDKAVSKGVFHRNNVSRRVSRLTRAVNSIATSLSK
ncbi:MAG: 30S ribosomal protein S20 [Deltaproteobacteria bacterium]|nr:30S ribosomal protein S20 [Deltaproteobacteria bacterium]